MSAELDHERVELVQDLPPARPTMVDATVALGAGVVLIWFATMSPIATVFLILGTLAALCVAYRTWGFAASALPLSWPALLYVQAGLMRLSYGYWPSQNAPDSAAAPLFALIWIAAAVAVFGGPVAMIVFARRLGDDLEAGGTRRRRALLSLIGGLTAFGYMIFLVATDPGNFFNWFVD